MMKRRLQLNAAPRSACSPYPSIWLILCCLSACTSGSDADLRSRRDGTDTSNAAATGDPPSDLQNAASVSGHVADDDFTTAQEATSVSSTNLTERMAVFESLTVDASGALVRSAVARVGLDGTHFQAANLPGDKMLMVTVDGHSAVVPALGSAAVGVVIDRSAQLATGLLQKLAATADGAGMIRAQTLDVNALNEIGALTAESVQRDQSAASSEALDHVVAGFLTASRKTLDAFKGKGSGGDEAAYAGRVRDSFARASSAVIVTAAVSGGTYNARLIAKSAGTEAQLGTVAATFEALGLDTVALVATAPIVRSYVYAEGADRIIASPTADPSQTKEQALAKLQTTVDSLSADDLAKQVNGALTPVEASAVIGAPPPVESPKGGTTGSTSSGETTGYTTGGSTSGGSTSGTGTTTGGTTGSSGGTTGGSTGVGSESASPTTG